MPRSFSWSNPLRHTYNFTAEQWQLIKGEFGAQIHYYAATAFPSKVHGHYQKTAEEVIKINQHIKKSRQTISKAASAANKRIKLLEKKGWTDSAAYKNWLAAGGEKFGVKGKTNAEVHAEKKRLVAFMEAESSTVTGMKEGFKRNLDLIAGKDHGFTIKDYENARGKMPEFFKALDALKEINRNIEDQANALGYAATLVQIQEDIEKREEEFNSLEELINTQIEKMNDIINSMSKEVKGPSGDLSGRVRFKIMKTEGIDPRF